MKPSSLISAMFVCVAMVGSAAYAAQPAPQPDEVKRVGLASALIEYGMESNDALALANAARMYRGFSARVLERGESGADGNAVDADALLEQAREFAQGDEALLAVVDYVERMEPGAKGVYIPSCYWASYCGWFGNCWYRWVCY